MELPSDLLRTFITAADMQSYTTAASIVHRTQSAVSMQIKRLEEITGKQLFLRNGRSMILTEEGRTLLHYARRILKLQDEAVAAIFQPEISGSVRLGAPDDFSDRLLPEVLSRFSEAYSQVQLNVYCDSSSKLLKAMNHGELDLVIHINNDIQSRGIIIHHEPVVWITSTKHLTHEKEPLPLAVYNKECIYRQWATKSLDNQSRDYRIAFSSPSTSGILAAVRGGLAIAAVGKNSIPENVQILGPDEGFPELPSAVVSLIKAPGLQSKTVDFLSDHIRNRFHELSVIGIDK